ncbi:cytochrome P450 [Gloeophyllum trabeum ATCC 11539]|uniref:Cytochrome P450 n=1 Tax=Gloeophyllum trabeum (strain ATCC 11539 / FP-39264 / Madison 617) TaxID=670483 RepID=S7RM24_GLOTA|nr:cytochrome P450 [Gloeophyllum trabeum ATCC 11539]EPQ55440.1 cytochrome P450 [Gloeophyllum trabeum ATCC 11539]
MDAQLVGVLVISVLLLVLYRRHTKLSIAYVRGPKADSFLFGHLRLLANSPIGQVHYKWQDEFGSVIRYKGFLGKDMLMISDLKALQYILNTAAYKFDRPEAVRQALLTQDGPDLVWSEGEQHKRQRKVMLPAFGGPEAKALYPVFKSKVEHLKTIWKDIISGTDKGTSATINVNQWLSRATLDAIGQAAFDYELGMLDNGENELGKLYQNFSLDTAPSGKIIADAVLDYLPGPVLKFIFETLPFRTFIRLREHRTVTRKVAKQLIDIKGQELLEGRGNRDVFSLLIKANGSEQSKSRLTDEELYAEMSVIFIAGHETTSNSLTWNLYELAKRPVMQRRIREEIREREAVIRARGDTEFSLTDIESLAFFQAFLKETLRMHPVVFALIRRAVKDIVLPLAQPIMDVSGKTRSELVVPKGTDISVPVGCYHRDKTVWGEDADTFNPERWMKGDAVKAASPMGVISNLMNFGSGTRSCIGWRFAMTEMQCFLVELINTFEFGLPAKDMVFHKVGSIVVVPVLASEAGKGAQMPLTISIADRD